jgi:cytochrome b561
MNKPNGYSGLQIGLHWLTALLIGTNYVISDGMEDAFDASLNGMASPVAATTSIHVYVGMAVLALVALRLVTRFLRGVPAEVETGSPLTRVAARVVHAALYVLLFAVPGFGILAWFGGIEVFGDLHVLAMNTLMAFALAHAAAAIFHHYVLRDQLIRRMTRPA